MQLVYCSLQTVYYVSPATYPVLRVVWFVSSIVSWYTGSLLEECIKYFKTSDIITLQVITIIFLSDNRAVKVSFCLQPGRSKISFNALSLSALYLFLVFLVLVFLDTFNLGSLSVAFIWQVIIIFTIIISV